MQQHSGEHMVSGIVHAMFGYHNVGFHMGKDLVTIDFDGPIEPEALAEIEEKANRAIWQNLPVRCWYPAPEELPEVNYRRKKDLPWPVRIVEFPGIDLCACCGTQVKYTGEIGLVKLFSCTKFHQGVRIEMASGGRALKLLSQVYEQNRQVSQAFSAKILETGAAARRMNEQLAAEKFRATGLQKQIFASIAAEYRDAENPVHVAPGLAPGAVRELADAIAGVCRGMATVLSGTDSTDYSICIVSHTQDVRPAGKAIAQALGGRGGGKPEAFQGSLKTTEADIRAYFHL
jgi:alanyl-tRNA synthetase